MEKRPRKTPAERARAQYTNYAVREPMELMDFLASKMPDASRTKLKSLLSKRVVFVDNVITTQFNFPLQPGMKVQISKQKGKKEFNNRLLKIIYEDAYIIVVEKMQGLLSVNTAFRTSVSRIHRSPPGQGHFRLDDVCQRRKDPAGSA